MAKARGLSQHAATGCTHLVFVALGPLGDQHMRQVVLLHLVQDGRSEAGQPPPQRRALLLGERRDVHLSRGREHGVTTGQGRASIPITGKHMPSDYREQQGLASHPC